MNKSISIVFACLCLCFVASVEAEKKFPYMCGRNFAKNYLNLCVKPQSDAAYTRLSVACRRREWFWFDSVRLLTLVQRTCCLRLFLFLTGDPATKRMFSQYTGINGWQLYDWCTGKLERIVRWDHVSKFL